MNFPLSLTVFLLTICSIQNGFVEGQGPGEPLFLTPYIEEGLYPEARFLSTVNGFLMPSYSGFITVNATAKAHMFFWFFPAQRQASTAPVIFWCEGGPGVSGMYSLFNENGPFQVDKDGEMTHREHSWNLDHNIIFTDNPIGAGFSFLEDEGGNLKSGTDPAHLYSFLNQFFKVFPDYRENDFYASGVSFGGIFAPTIAHEIHIRNQEGIEERINLKGVLVESPWSDPIRQVNYGEFLYHIGFLDQSDRAYMNEQTSLMEDYIREERWAEADQIWIDVLVRPYSYFFNRTGLTNANLYNYLEISEEDTSEYYVPFVTQDVIRNAIHVGSTPYLPVNQPSYEDTGKKSVKPYIETLLDAGYRVLFYAGQLDVITYHLGIANMMDGLEWGGAEEFRQAKSFPWRANKEDVSGFVRTASNLTYVLMRNAGHDANTDQPTWGLDILTRFVNNMPFTD